MPFDSLPGRLGAIPQTQVIPPPPIIKPSKGPLIATIGEGLAKILAQFTPEAKRADKLKELQSAYEIDRLKRYFGGDQNAMLSPLQKSVIQKNIAATNAFNVKSDALKRKSEPSANSVLYFNRDGTPIRSNQQQSTPATTPQNIVQPPTDPASLQGQGDPRNFQIGPKVGSLSSSSIDEPMVDIGDGQMIPLSQLVSQDLA